jgi:hypothetical protein
MKWLLFALGLVVTTTAIGTRVQAQNDPWCARYSFRDGATCGFTSFAQCMATVSGIGGFCEANNLYPLPHPAAKPGRHP